MSSGNCNAVKEEIYDPLLSPERGCFQHSCEKACARLGSQKMKHRNDAGFNILHFFCSNAAVPQQMLFYVE